MKLDPKKKDEHHCHYRQGGRIISAQATRDALPAKLTDNLDKVRGAAVSSNY
jgi:hypothetical protein